ncbi:MAG: DUF559 domain-containing protein [Chloroflexi bacterium]|nr:DUF559 domain-containing protein [Chloroflexota bacterium]
MPAPQSIRDLVQRFQSQSASYHRPSYNETELRRDFLDPFFAALGWDMTNTGGGSEKYREVIHEASVEVEGAARAADYAFRMGGNNVFFVEAKKPAVNIVDSAAAAFQLRSYGWSGKLALSLLTDFEQLAVYDCRSKPKPGEAAHIGRVNLYHYSEYVAKWDEIYSRFSREAVFTGKFDEFAGGTKGKKGTTDVDDAFLEMLEGWRELLARNIALRNPDLSVRDLNFAVQTTIDRIIFLRICEDRGIEPDNALRSATDGKDIYQDLLALFRSADKKYNSGLFHFSDEKHQTSPADTLTPTLKIDDKVLKEILAGLYHPSPYAFKYIPADILGQVYERFLGKVIRLTAGHQAKVEEKPEVRKAGGVYYTPTYIVEYIVKNTLGDLLQGQTPETQAARPLRVLDPACGSGSFLLGAYQYLLDWYLEWYAQNEPARHARGKSPAVVEVQGGWQLTMEKKKEILLAHIFGVDIDQQAVEVTKLSLLLKVVENPGQLSLLDERILPDLGENVKCGNSLIGPDYYNGRQMPLLGDDELYRVNPFDWQAAFPQVFAPEKPARQTVTKPALPPELLQRCRDLRKNQTSAEGLLWSLLRDRQLNGLKFRRQHPLGGYILDFYCHEERLAVELDGSGHLEAGQARHDEQRTRDLAALGVRVIRMWNHEVLSNPQGALLAILDAVENPHPGPHPGGEGRTALGSGLSSSPREALPKGAGRGARGEGGFDAVIGNPPYGALVTAEEAKYYREKYEVKDIDTYALFIELAIKKLTTNGKVSMIVPTGWYSGATFSNLRKFFACWTDPETFVNLPYDIFGAWVDTTIFIATKHDQRLKWPRQEISTTKIITFPKRFKIHSLTDFNIDESKIDICDWFDNGSDEFLTYADMDSMKIMRKVDFRSKPLSDFADVQRGVTPFHLDGEPKYRTSKLAFTGTVRRYIFDKGEEKYIRYDETLAEYKPERYFTGERLLVRELISRQFRLQAVKVQEDFITNKSMQSILHKDGAPYLDYLLGLINSTLLSWYFLNKSNIAQRDDFPKIVLKETRSLPIRMIDFNDPADVKRHERMVALVENMLGLHKQLAAARSPQEKELLQRQIAFTDREIDALVYELYGLTEEEIKIVEGGE